MKTKRRFTRRILIDLGGVLNKYKGDYDENFIPEIRRGARGFLEKLSKIFPDFEFYLYTSRDSQLVYKWLIDNRIDCYFKGVTNIKLPAYLTIDDRAICFKGNYGKLLKEVKEFKVWWKKKSKI